MSAGDLPEPPAPTSRHVPRPAPRATPRPGAEPAAAAPGARGPGADVSTRPDGAAELEDVLADLLALPEDAPVLEQAVLLEDVHERLAQRLSGAAR